MDIREVAKREWERLTEPSAIVGNSGQSFRKFGNINVSIEWDNADPRVIVLQNIERERYAGRDGDGSRILEMLKALCNQFGLYVRGQACRYDPLDSSKPPTEDQQTCLIAWYKRHGFFVVVQKTAAPLIWFPRAPQTGPSLQRKSRSMAISGSSAGGMG
jgi:hypothetical protein